MPLEHPCEDGGHRNESVSILQSENLRRKDTQKKNLKTKTQVLLHHAQATKTHRF